MTHTDEQFDTLDEMKDDLRKYFDKNLKPKKDTMKNADREILCYALERAYKAGFATDQSAKVEEVRKIIDKVAPEIDKLQRRLDPIEWQTGYYQAKKDIQRILLSPTPTEVTSDKK